jgi:hypothetical protein
LAAVGSRYSAVISRRRSLAWLGASASLLLSRAGAGLEPEVPIRLQVSLLDRVIRFDRNFGVRVHGRLSLAVVVDESNEDSVRIGTQLLSELGARETLGGHPFLAVRVPFKSAQGLSDECKRLKAGVVYVTPGVREPIARLATTLLGLKVMTVGTLPEQASQGLVLGSAVRSGKPRVLVNLSQARLQDIDFRADFLRLAEVVG